MSQLNNNFKDYFVFLSKTLQLWCSAVLRSVDLMRPLINQAEQLRLCSRAQLDEEFFQKFPGIKEKLLGKIILGIEEEMIPLMKLQEEMKTHADGLKSRLNVIEQSYSTFNPEEEREFNPAIPSVEKLLELAVDSWRCFHVLWLGVKTALETVDYYSSESINRISDAFFKYKEVESHLQYTSELTSYLWKVSKEEKGSQVK